MNSCLLKLQRQSKHLFSFQKWLKIERKFISTSNTFSDNSYYYVKMAKILFGMKLKGKLYIEKTVLYLKLFFEIA